MLSFITYKDAPEQVEIVGDEEGLSQLISYLEEIRSGRDHMHLVIDTELSPYPITGTRRGKTMYAKHVRLEFAESSTWQE